MRALYPVVVLLAATPLAGQASSELGTTLGLVVLRRSGTTLTSISAPGSGIFDQPTLYYTNVSPSGLMVEPQLGFTFFSTSGGGSYRRVNAVLQVGWLQHPERRASLYWAVNGGFLSVDAGGGADSEFAFGAAMGYRTRVGQGLALRVEGRYRRWLGDLDGLNEFGVTLGVGGII
jgi:hypothetical protein